MFIGPAFNLYSQESIHPSGDSSSYTIRKFIGRFEINFIPQKKQQFLKGTTDRCTKRHFNKKHNLAERGTYEINVIRHNFSNYVGHDDLCHASDRR